MSDRFTAKERRGAIALAIIVILAAIVAFFINLYSDGYSAMPQSSTGSVDTESVDEATVGGDTITAASKRKNQTRSHKYSKKTHMERRPPKSFKHRVAPGRSHLDERVSQ